MFDDELCGGDEFGGISDHIGGRRNHFEEVNPMFGGGGGRDFSGGVQKPRNKVPVTIVCGFLGAGKTTLMQHMLSNRENMKIGVVVNDVAEVNVDSELLSITDADGIVGLQNGCACCSGRDDLFARLEACCILLDTAPSLTDAHHHRCCCCCCCCCRNWLRATGSAKWISHGTGSSWSAPVWQNRKALRPSLRQ